ncbi:hypothetical protein A3H90_03735 [Candidatus Peribacteria bacterium RIFCSPLOWO2_02_FULL_55_36]|nr:MAG: hypothetical protein A3H90_03735 [Candidatus Peribacteria bacterium RIFCSPLOWO2_02_FULL_55_36]
MNNPPSAEELELLQEYGGHDPEVGDDLLAALRKERETVLQPPLEDPFFRQRLRAFVEATEMPR